MESNLNNILAILKTNSGTYIDDHHRHEKTTGIAKAIAVHGNHVVLLCPDARYFSVNRLYVENGQVHLSPISVGGVVSMSKGETLEEAIKVYNEEEMIFPRAKLTEVTYLTPEPIVWVKDAEASERQINPQVQEQLNNFFAPTNNQKEKVMNQINNNFVFRATKQLEEVVTALTKQKFGDTRFIGSILNDVFATALMHADYYVSDEQIAAVEIGNGTGYYDPLMSAVFLGDDGQPIPQFSSVAIADRKTNRRLYLIVVNKGVNIIVHDRHAPRDQNDVRLVKTGGPATELLNMNKPLSSDSDSSIVRAAIIFGFELDHNNRVYVPVWKTNNWFMHMSQFLNMPVYTGEVFLETDPE